ncbi:hypothetical protein QJQ45_026757 [Haematococcus lacustris]|nr:hypothetical protein QJQ45_026757 [Haematococcus lacustris]
MLQQRSDLQAQLPSGAFSDRPICALVPGVPQDGYVHHVAGDACNKPSSYAGVAKATRDLEQHTDTYLDRSGLEGAVQQLHDSGQLCLEHLQRPELQQRQQELEQTQRPETSNITAGQPCAVCGVVGFVCCHGVPLLVLYQALGSGEDAAAVSIIEEQLEAMVRGEPAP